MWWTLSHLYICISAPSVYHGNNDTKRLDKIEQKTFMPLTIFFQFINDIKHLSSLYMFYSLNRIVAIHGSSLYTTVGIEI
jgi:hypothetical protein